MCDTYILYIIFKTAAIIRTECFLLHFSQFEHRCFWLDQRPRMPGNNSAIFTIPLVREDCQVRWSYQRPPVQTFRSSGSLSQHQLKILSSQLPSPACILPVFDFVLFNQLLHALLASSLPTYVFDFVSV